MAKKYTAIVKDNWPDCPGKTVLGTYPTRKEAQWRIDAEMEAAAELFTDGRRWLVGEIVVTQQEKAP